MTRIFTEGAEMQDTVFWSGFYQNVVTIGNTTPFASSYYYHYGWDMGSWKNFTAISECYARVRLRVKTHSLDHAFISFRLSSTTVAYIAEDALNRWIANVTTVGVVGTSVGVIILNSWYLLEVYFKEANAPNGRFVLSVDGNIVIDYTGDTQPAADTTFDNVYFRAASTNDSFDIDDLALNDTAGAVDNSWCGDGVVIRVPPDEDGTSPGNWTGSDADSTDNWLMVDEYPSDGDTTYVYHDATVTGHQEQFHVTSPSMTGKTILRVWPEVRARKTGAVANTLKLGLLGSAGDDMSAGRVVSIGSYTRIVGNDYKANPADAGTWLEADINAQEIIIETAA